MRTVRRRIGALDARKRRPERSLFVYPESFGIGCFIARMRNAARAIETGFEDSCASAAAFFGAGIFARPDVFKDVFEDAFTEFGLLLRLREGDGSKHETRQAQADAEAPPERQLSVFLFSEAGARNSTQALLGAPGAKNIALCAGKFPDSGPAPYAGNGRVTTPPWAFSPVLAS